jgi:hypothetical protein
MQSLSNIYPPLQCAYQATTSPSNRKEVLGGLFKTPLDVILLNGLTCGYASYRSWLGIVLDKPLANPQILAHSPHRLPSATPHVRHVVQGRRRIVFL